ncbi:prolyl oligopeptidase family serine peptidase [uncultured Muriicola sp.]|uniref:S9 family peptidase n=1 Tax=uncultured Muriicola sp. TaxID=1583102 RepID=UPI0026260155|nr:prolyl oligopeptidase family serine peptidase [uncultured Muriicola sp.]
MKPLYCFLLVLLSFSVSAQKKVLDHPDLALWNSIETPAIAPNGAYVLYSLEQGEKDQFLHLKDASGKELLSYERASKGAFTYDSKHAVFTISAWKDSVLAMKRKKVKKKDMPKDSLGIYHLTTGQLERIGNIKSYKIPEKWSGYLAYQLEEIEAKKDTTQDSSDTKKTKKKKEKKVSKKNGYHLLVRDIATEQQDTFKFVTDYTFAKRGKSLAWATTGENDSANAAVYVLNFEKGSLTKVHEAKKATYAQLSLSETGQHLGFVVDADTTKVQLRPRELYHWQQGMATAEKLVDGQSLGNDLRPSATEEVHFSKDETKLYFGLAKPPIIKDTLLTEEEIVNVEVWTYDEPRLYTVQELQLKNDTVQAYTTVIHLNKKKTLTQLANATYPDFQLTDKGNANTVLLSNPTPYALESQWTGERARDYALVDLTTGSRKKVLTKLAGRVTLSPKGAYVFGYNNADSLWFTYNISKDQYRALTKGEQFYDELHDSPSFPSPYGFAGWTEKDGSLLLYDRYDIWKFDPATGSSTRLTKGRETRTVYRYIRLDWEKEYIDTSEKALLETFNETDKSSGFAAFDFKSNTVQPLLNGPYRYGYPIKSALANKLLFTRQSFTEFPDLWVADMDLKSPARISTANPQQADYNWGSIELITWTSLDGIELTGLLVKPEDFDPSKKYPMLVNFYEKSADGLHRHRAPTAGRSTINYSFYASRGYLIFNPDIHYRIGYPGESAYNCVIPGVTSLIEKGFVDKENIGVQGHSWGGYQIAYLVTRTDIFKAAEAGAPVPNMISAYGGIRWWTGLSRQFQYEHTQSRIGGTPWEYPTRYLENSPIFTMDKINTPLLIMHNDADGHVPWYQGIEFFVSLRRLGKPSWFLNYNGEPHWPLKLQNRKDFTIRMAQFFDHYLKGDPKPQWMERGVPAMEKGINQGYELVEEDK